MVKCHLADGNGWKPRPLGSTSHGCADEMWQNIGPFWRLSGLSHPQNGLDQNAKFQVSYQVTERITWIQPFYAIFGSPKEEYLQNGRILTAPTSCQLQNGKWISATSEFKVSSLNINTIVLSKASRNKGEKTHVLFSSVPSVFGLTHNIIHGIGGNFPMVFGWTTMEKRGKIHVSSIQKPLSFLQKLVKIGFSSSKLII